MNSFSVKKFAEGGLADDEDDTLTGDEGIDGVAPTLAEASPAEINAYYAKVFSTQGDMKKLISEAADRIRQQRAPSVWGALSEGLAQPKTQPGISGTLANISSGLSEYRKGKAAFDEAQADKLMAYRLKELELGGSQAKSEFDLKYKLATLAAAQAAAPRPMTQADTKAYPGLNPAEYMFVGGRPVLIPSPRAAPQTSTDDLKSTLLQVLLDGGTLTPEQQKVLDYLRAGQIPVGFTVGEGGVGLKLDPGYLVGQGRLADARRAPPKATSSGSIPDPGAGFVRVTH